MERVRVGARKQEGEEEEEEEVKVKRCFSPSAKID